MAIEIHPITLFKRWLELEREQSSVDIPSAGCLSTMGLDNFPNARFVALKDIMDGSFIITGPMNSRKGLEVDANNKVALTFWWTATQRQVRIQGMATKLSEGRANHYFNMRSVASQAVSWVCHQGNEIKDRHHLKAQWLEVVSESEKITKPNNWGGISIEPIRIEFMEFNKSRFHHRTLYLREDTQWTHLDIQP